MNHYCAFRLTGEYHGKCSPMCFIIAGDTSSAMSCHGAGKEWSRQGGTMGNTRRRQVRGRWAAPAPCRPGTRAMGPQGAADGVQVA